MSDANADFKSLLDFAKEKMPKFIFLEKPKLLKDFSSLVDKIASTNLYPSWYMSIKVGGVLFNQLAQKEPNNPNILKMFADAKAARQKIAKRFEEPSKTSYTSSSSSSSSSSPPPTPEVDPLTAPAEVTTTSVEAPATAPTATTTTFMTMSGATVTATTVKEEKEHSSSLSEKSVSSEGGERQKRREIMRREVDSYFQDLLHDKVPEEQAMKMKQIFEQELLSQILEQEKAERTERVLGSGVVFHMPPSSTTATLTATTTATAKIPPKEIIDLTKIPDVFTQKGRITKGEREILGMSTYEEEHNFSEHKFWRFDTNTYESTDLFMGRKRVWDWMVKCVEGPNPEKTSFYISFIKWRRFI
jgi:hypothetical protein